MDIKSFFFPEKDEVPPLPKPLTGREVLEDIDNAAQDDPVIQFGLSLRKQGSRKFSLEAIPTLDETLEENGFPSALSPKGRQKNEVAASPKSPSHSFQAPASPGRSSLFERFKIVVETNEKVQEELREAEAKIKKFDEANSGFVDSLEPSESLL